MFHKPSAEERERNTTRITTQYRNKGSMVYELMCIRDELEVRMTPRANDGDDGDWCVVARPGRAEGAVTVTAWGSTRSEALTEVSRSWAEKGLPSYDWEAVATALRAVRALEKL